MNKPYLPLPAGELSLKQAWLIVIFNLLAGLLIFRLTEADAITTTLFCLGLFFGTFYSAPPFRFKGNPITTSIVLPLVILFDSHPFVKKLTNNVMLIIHDRYIYIYIKIIRKKNLGDSTYKCHM